MITALYLALTLFLPAGQDFREFTTQGDDGRSLRLRYYEAPYGGAPVVVIAHDFGGSMQRWEDVAERLKSLGFGVTLFNFSGHGPNGDYYRYTDEQIAALSADLKLAVDFAHSRAGGATYVIGAGVGANLALAGAAENPEISKVVAISPALDYRGVRLTRLMTETLGARLMLIASREDAYAARSVELFANAFRQQPAVQLYNNAGHGVWIIKRAPESLATIARWLSGN